MIPSKKLMKQILLRLFLLLLPPTWAAGQSPATPSDQPIDPPTLQYEAQLDRSLPFRSPLQSSSIGADTLEYEGLRYSLAVSPLLSLRGHTQLLERNDFIVVGFGLRCTNIGVSCSWIVREDALYLSSVRPYGSAQELTDQTLAPTSATKGLSPWLFRLRSFLRGGQGDTPFCAEWFDGTLRARIAEDRKASSAVQHELLLSFNRGKLVALQRIAIQVLEKKTFSK